jgi:hypothetical protein
MQLLEDVLWLWFLPLELGTQATLPPQPTQGSFYVPSFYLLFTFYMSPPCMSILAHFKLISFPSPF